MEEEAKQVVAADPTEKEAGEAHSINLRIPPPDEYKYVSIAAVAISQMDVRLTFAEVLPPDSAITKVGLVMAPEHAAALALTLINHLRIFERNFGEIRLEQWQNAKRKFAPKTTQPENRK